MYPSPRPRPATVPEKIAGVAGLGCLGCLGLLVVLMACGVVLNAVDPKPAPVPAGRTAAATPAKPPVTASVTAPTPAPTADRAARLMCAHTVQAQALHRAGWTGKAESALRRAADAAARSHHPQVAVLADETSGTFARRAGAWCKANLPEVTASPVPRPPEPGKTTGRPEPRETTRPAAPATTRRPAPAPKPKKPPAVGDVRPGAFCSPRGAIGRYRGRIYTCKGPGQPRWRP